MLYQEKARILIRGAYCVGRVHNMLLASIIVVGAHCVGRVQNMLLVL